MVAKAEDATSLDSFETLCPQTLPKRYNEVGSGTRRHQRGTLMDGLLYILGQTIFSCSDKKITTPDLAANVLVKSMVGPS